MQVDDKRYAPGGGAVHPCRERADPQFVHRLHLRPARALARALRDPLAYRGHIELGERRRRLRHKRGQLVVTDLDQFRVQRRDRAGGMIHEYHLVA